MAVTVTDFEKWPFKVKYYSKDNSLIIILSALIQILYKYHIHSTTKDILSRMVHAGCWQILLLGNLMSSSCIFSMFKPYEI